jgi:hypothetical protein
MFTLKQKGVIGELATIPKADFDYLQSTKGNFKEQIKSKILGEGDFRKLLEKSFFDGVSQEGKRALAALNKLSATERHEIFGAALTETEAKDAQQWIPKFLGGGLANAYDMAVDSYGRNVKTLGDLGGFHGNDYLRGKFPQQLKSGEVENWRDLTPDTTGAVDAPTDTPLTVQQLDSEINNLDKQISLLEGKGSGNE